MGTLIMVGDTIAHTMVGDTTIPIMVADTIARIDPTITTVIMATIMVGMAAMVQPSSFSLGIN